MPADRYIFKKGDQLMGLTYKPLFHLLVDREMKGTDLTKNGIISAPTLTKLNKGEPVDGKVIIRICEYLQCQPGDVMAYVKDTGEEI
jgi:DNA-binding Xre family transcriptional regulator